MLSGNKAFDSDLLLISLFFLQIGILIFRKINFINIKFFIFLTIFISLSLLQIFKFQNTNINAYFGMLLTILNAYIIIKILQEEFLDIFIKIMIFIAYLSIIIFAFINIFPSISDFLINHFSIFEQIKNEYSVKKYFLGFYTIIVPQEWRNSGPFWEPGAYVGYLIITLLFLFIKEKKILTKKNFIIYISILTTVSTTGYIVVVVFITTVILINNKNIISRIILGTFILILSFNIMSLDFMGEKIKDRINIANTARLDSDVSSRFLDVLRDYNDIQGHEIIGRGVTPNTRFENYSIFTLTSRTNGFTDTLVRYGIPFTILIFIYIYISFNNLAKNKTIASLSTLMALLLLQSEAYFNYPLFWSLLFLYVINQTKEKNVIYNNSSF